MGGRRRATAGARRHQVRPSGAEPARRGLRLPPVHTRELLDAGSQNAVRHLALREMHRLAVAADRVAESRPSAFERLEDDLGHLLRVTTHGNEALVDELLDDL